MRPFARRLDCQGQRIRFQVNHAKGILSIVIVLGQDALESQDSAVKASLIVLES